MRIGRMCFLVVWGFCFAAIAAGQETPAIENEALSLRFDAKGNLESFVDKAHGHEQLDAGAAGECWMAELPGGRALASENAKTFTWKRSGSTLNLVWSGFELAEAPDLKVTAEVSLVEGKASSLWRMRVDGLGKSGLRSMHYPRIARLAKRNSETVAVPVWMGERTQQARELLNRGEGIGQRWDWEYPGLLSMQCMTFYGTTGGGIIVSTNDTQALRKEFAVFGDGHGGLGMEVVHLVGAGDSFETPCDVMVDAFEGDWYTAAVAYRAWAKNQQWVKESRVKRGATPDWVRDTGLWVWNRGRSGGVLEPAEVLQEKAGVPVSVFWHWWHGCAYDAGFPEYLPPREGEEAFRQAVANAHEQDIHAIVYMNQRLWGMSTKSWTDEGAERYAVKGPDGKVSPEVYNTFTKSPCASMCMGTEFWRGKYAGLAEGAVRGLGVDGIYMDQACSSCACYDPSHGHPLGGGAYWMEGFRLLEGNIRQRCADVKAVALAGEGCGEAWLPHLDIMLSLQVSMERYAAPGQWQVIPFFHAVYHDCATFYGNYSSLTRPPYDDLWPAEFAPKKPLELLDRKFSTQFRLEQARAFVWGQQPTVANVQPSHFEDRAEEMAYVLQLARLRIKALPYLRDGVFLRPPDINAPEREIPMSRLSIYAGQQDSVKEFSQTMPMALAAAWQSPQGTVAVSMANVDDNAASLRLVLKKGEYPVPERGRLVKITVDGTQEVGTYEDGQVDLGVELGPREAAVYEVVAR